MTERKETTSLTATVYCEDCGRIIMKSGVSGKKDVDFIGKELAFVSKQIELHTERTGHKNVSIKLG